MASKAPPANRLRPRELFFVLLGVVTGASLAVFWFRLVPELMQLKGLDVDALSGLGQLVMHPGFQVPALFVGVVIMAAGIATRTSSGKDKATWILAGGAVLLFATLLLSVNAVFDPVFLEPDAAAGDDDWQD